MSNVMCVSAITTKLIGSMTLIGTRLQTQSSPSLTNRRSATSIIISRLLSCLPYWYCIDSRAATFWTISNGHNSVTHHLIPFVFGSRVGFSGVVARTALFPGESKSSNPRWLPVVILKNSNGHMIYSLFYAIGLLLLL